jgi:hypothetical protein
MKSLSNHITESLAHYSVIEHHLHNNISIRESYLRIDSESYAELLRESRRLYDEGNLEVDSEESKFILEKLKSGEKAIYMNKKSGRRQEVILHTPKPNPDRAEDYKRFIVFIESGKTDEETGLPIAKAIKFASWGQGLDINNDDKKAVNSFWARHQCDTKTNVNTAGFWACRTPELFGDMLKLRGGKSRW